MSTHIEEQVARVIFGGTVVIKGESNKLTTKEEK